LRAQILRGGTLRPGAAIQPAPAEQKAHSGSPQS
jgi:hypothetical protein